MSKARNNTISQDDYNALLRLEDKLVRLSLEMREIADASGLSRRQIARRMGNSSTSNLQRILSGAAYSATLETLARLAWSCNHDLQISLLPRQRLLPTEVGYPNSSHECSNVLDFSSAYIKRYAQQPCPEWPSKVSDG